MIWPKITKVVGINLYYYLSKTLIMLTTEFEESLKIGRIWNQAQTSLTASTGGISMGTSEVTN